jgi:DNA-binding CsgD family transcriptional regulator
MEKLNTQDCRNLLDCVGELYAHHTLDTFAERLLTAIQKIIAADYWTAAEINEHFKRIGCKSNPAKISDYMTYRRYRETAVYREFFRGPGAEFLLASSPPSPRGGRQAGFAFIRSRGADFSETDRLKLDLLDPHIRRAYAQAERITRLREENANLAEALAATRQGVIMLSAAGAILLCTEPARQCLARYFKSPRNNVRRLPKTLRLWLRREKLPAAKNGGYSPRPSDPLVTERGEGRLAIHLLSGQTAGQRVLILEERRVAHSASLLQERLGLTPREAEVLFWVAHGKTNSETGLILRIKTATVEKHLERIHAKLHIETRTAAALCAHEVFKEF